MSTKIQVYLTSAIAGVFGFIAWLTTVPPEMQSGILGSLSQIFPVAWQPTIGLWSKGITTLLGIYAIYKAAHSGPVDKP